MISEWGNGTMHMSELARTSIKRIRPLVSRTPRGFTLVETLVAVLLLSVAVAGPLTIASRASASAAVAKDQITAYYLAQDALEYVRFKRDSNCLVAFANNPSVPCPNGTSAGQWLYELGPCLAPNTCRVDTQANTITSCSGDTCRLYYNNTSKFYTHTSSGNSATKFRRYVQITVSGGEAQVAVTVSWTSAFGAATRSVVLREYIYNWQ